MSILVGKDDGALWILEKIVDLFAGELGNRYYGTIGAVIASVIVYAVFQNMRKGEPAAEDAQTAAQPAEALSLSWFVRGMSWVWITVLVCAGLAILVRLFGL